MIRFWWFLLPESFWLDETLTAFVVRFGANHPSLAVAPGVSQSIYYWLPRASAQIAGFSEFSLRLPSFLCSVLSLFFLGRLAGRLIHPHAGWFAAFLYFVPHGFVLEAADARPYALGVCVASAALWRLVRWLDGNRWWDAVAFILLAAMLPWVQLIYWPFLAVFAFYAVARRLRGETTVSGKAMCVAAAGIAAAVAPLIPATLGLVTEAKVHIVTDMPTLNRIRDGFQLILVLACGVAGWVAGRTTRGSGPVSPTRFANVVLVLSWWLWQPLILLVFTWITGNSVFVPRYFSLAVPGVLLAGTMAAGRFVPASAWRPLAMVLAAGVLIAAHWRFPFPPSRNSHWREAAQAANHFMGERDTPIVCPSPFVEAQPPFWQPGYSLPGFLYAHLAAYPIQAQPLLLPARLSSEGETYAREWIRSRALPAGRFLIYSGTYDVELWSGWFVAQPELARWTRRRLGSFGDVGLWLFERPKS